MNVNAVIFAKATVQVEYNMDNKELKESQRKHWEEAGVDIDKECTYNDCYINKKSKCQFAFNLYNYDRDCLWLK